MRAQLGLDVGSQCLGCSTACFCPGFSAGECQNRLGGRGTGVGQAHRKSEARQSAFGSFRSIAIGWGTDVACMSEMWTGVQVLLPLSSPLSHLVPVSLVPLSLLCSLVDPFPQSLFFLTLPPDCFSALFVSLHPCPLGTWVLFWVPVARCFLWSLLRDL